LKSGGSSKRYSSLSVVGMFGSAISVLNVDYDVMRNVPILTIHSYITHFSMGLYHPLDGVTNFKYKLLYFLTTNNTIFKEKGISF
jgi:hypothetical protein